MTRSFEPLGDDVPEPPPEPSEADLARLSLEPGLYVVATPIGNLRDITLRALDILRGADLILAEDTRVARKLLSAHAIPVQRLMAYHDHNAAGAGAEAIAALRQGAAVALISDAGTPLVSDPGFRLVQAAIAANVRVIPAPGPSAPLAALVASGLPCDRFLFAGFAPPKAGARRAFFGELLEVRATLILFETGPRLGASLADMAQVFGPRLAVIARELTKLFEEVRRGNLLELAREAPLAERRGEHVILIAPPLEMVEAPSEEALEAAMAQALREGGVKQAAGILAARFGLTGREAYDRALAYRRKTREA